MIVLGEIIPDGFNKIAYSCSCGRLETNRKQFASHVLKCQKSEPYMIYEVYHKK